MWLPMHLGANLEKLRNAHFHIYGQFRMTTLLNNRIFGQWKEIRYVISKQKDPSQPGCSNLEPKTAANHSNMMVMVINNNETKQIFHFLFLVTSNRNQF